MISIDERDVRSELGPLPTTLYRSDTEGGILLVLAPGAGAPRAHPFIVTISMALAEHGVHVQTFDFAYAAAGRKAPDRMPKLVTAYRAVLEDARERLGGTLFVGGKSMGSRVAAEVLCEAHGAGPSDLAGLVAFGYPLVPKGREAERTPREALLGRVPGPILVVQGAKDAFGDRELMTDVIEKLDAGRGRVTLEIVAHADHAFTLPKRALVDRTLEDVWRTIGATAAAWIRRIARP